MRKYKFPQHLQAHGQSLEADIDRGIEAGKAIVTLLRGQISASDQPQEAELILRIVQAAAEKILMDIQHRTHDADKAVMAHVATVSIYGYPDESQDKSKGTN